MADLNALMVFARVVESGSFSGAAKSLGMPVSTVSRRVAELENRLSMRLLERSTRRLRLTDVGADIFEQAQRGIDVSDAIDAIASNRISEVQGLLRLSAPPNIADSLLVPLVSAFQASYPAVNIHIMVTDRYVDHIADGVDIAFRVGDLKDSRLVARRLLNYRHRLVASPHYLARTTPPQKPTDLLDHRLLAFSSMPQLHSWTFKNDETTETLTFRPHLAMNDYASIAAALISSDGIGDLPPIVLPSLIENGQLMEVMLGWRFQAFDLSMVHLGNRHVSRAERLFREFAPQMALKLFKELPV